MYMYVCLDSDDPSYKLCNQILTYVYFFMLSFVRFFILFCQDDPLEETGWKLVHGDVFRPPRYPTMLVVCLGSGIQILSMVMIVIGECVCVLCMLNKRRLWLLVVKYPV